MVEMKKVPYLLIIAFIIGCNSSNKTPGDKSVLIKKALSPSTYANTITQSELKKQLYIYSSDEFEGRETGSLGQKKAVSYIKKIYKNLGIPAAKKNGDYFQKVPLEFSKLPDGFIDINNHKYMIGTDFLSFSTLSGNYNEIIYAGYGIEDKSYSDYKNIDAKGKILLIKSGEPINDQGNYIISGTKEKSIWSNMSESIGKRIELAVTKGVKVVLYYDPINYNRLQSHFISIKQHKNNKMILQNDISSNFSTLFINTTIAKTILTTINKENTTKKIDTPISFNVENTSATISSENVVAFIKGSEKPEEYIVISSHLDHLGVTKDGLINNGADDDGSGTVALFEIAKAFKKAKKEGNGPKRSIVFLHLTGEEKGLLGSKYYTDFNPIFPLSNTIANLNIDMIGRIDPKRKGNRNYIYLIGSDKLSTELHQISEQVNKEFTKIELDYTYNKENDPNRFYYRSDHYNFAKHNVPVIFYFNGTHEDYHKPTDTPDKINYDLLENRTKLIFYTAWQLANQKKRIVADKAM